MSEAMTNSEIEDVLTSIRRLVSQEGQRTDTTPLTLARHQSGRLVLTAAQRVDAAPEAPPQAPTQAPVAVVPAPLSLPEPDFRALEATIAELEAAVSASGTGFEPDGTEAPAEPPKAREGGATVTELYGKLGFVRRAVSARRHAAEAETATATATVAPLPLAPLREPARPELAPADVAAAPTVPHQVSLDDDEDDETIETVIDEEMLRAIVRELVHEVLDDLLSERIRQRARWAVRKELAKALEEGE